MTLRNVSSPHTCAMRPTGQREEGSVSEAFWPDIHVDLAGACLVNFSLVHCRIDVVTCDHATFIGETICRGLICDLAFFQGATFSGHTDFRSAVFTNDVWFAYSRFATDVWFHADEFYPGARFGRHAPLQGVSFIQGAKFDHATFSGSATFVEANYTAGAKTIHLEGAHIQDLNAVSPEVTKAPSNWKSEVKPSSA
ncbi:pentapeptide repeat-containing protein [Nonomuraea guangzhouensis]|uniref:Pentapeptide repeat-containing protein n=1 Tax=Nonomuraea guangzhouensis TaxID=1291555 RepID=A0ABW4GSY6_9ACTN|nr:pentapeptide repeat-containing protein [Nonomuraea guangzhouensis]